MSAKLNPASKVRSMRSVAFTFTPQTPFQGLLGPWSTSKRTLPTPYTFTRPSTVAFVS